MRSIRKRWKRGVSWSTRGRLRTLLAAPFTNSPDVKPAISTHDGQRLSRSILDPSPPWPVGSTERFDNPGMVTDAEKGCYGTFRYPPG